ncbi:MAG TPA: 16S rRNA (adenine(1518)-N(6)/adenine(1519)-N(6))-dimethyltransferase RsmA [Gemmatimonadaceae bacterium]|nr:16S rRNA (adenine(1518)-N(6)/adenine(1519)-N(6))-dimethyltransferase RsmA [Gemmatimonadaceae bacterium]
MAPRGRGGYPPVLKRLGQHFLADPRILERIADALGEVDGRTVIEIGPGRGALTELLVARGARVTAVELDRALAEVLRERYAARGVTVVQGDILETPLAALADGPFLLVGNVPYYITTPILFHALRPPRPERAVYLVQREVGERIVAAPGSKVYGALSVNVQAVASAELLFGVPAGAFRPPPTVESAVVRLTPRTDPAVTPDREDALRALVQEAFGLRRKQLRRVVRTVARLGAEAADAALVAAAIDPEARPETLAPADFARLLGALEGTGAR